MELLMIDILIQMMILEVHGHPVIYRLDQPLNQKYMK